MAELMTLKKFEALSPFEIKDELINLAKATSKATQSAFLNAGRVSVSQPTTLSCPISSAARTSALWLSTSTTSPS